MPRINTGLRCFSNELNLNTVLIARSCSPMQKQRVTVFCGLLEGGGAVMRQIKGRFLLAAAVMEGC